MVRVIKVDWSMDRRITEERRGMERKDKEYET
jgi:hypothetical protein